jgi:hypothetical protein
MKALVRLCSASAILFLFTCGGDDSTAPTSAPVPPGEVTASVGQASDTSLVVSWSRSSATDFASYAVYYAVDSVGDTALLQPVIVDTVDDTVLTFVALLPGTRYAFRVAVYDLEGLGSLSVEASATTLSPLDTTRTLSLSLEMPGRHEAQFWGSSITALLSCTDSVDIGDILYRRSSPGPVATGCRSGAEGPSHKRGVELVPPPARQ